MLKEQGGCHVKYRAVLLDADDTIFDFAACERSAFGGLCAALGVPFDGELLVRYQRINERLWAKLARGETTTGRLRSQRFAELWHLMPGDAERVGDQFIALLGEQCAMFPGARQALVDLSAKLPLALVTNGIGDAQRSRLLAAGIDKLFASVVVSEDIGAAKPEKLPFITALSTLGAAAKDAVMVGDSAENDIAGAQRVGLHTIWVNSGGQAYPFEQKPSHETRSLAEAVLIILR